MLYVLLALSVVISVFGMVNTMVLAVHERTREIGMLRAVGMTRRQARRMVRGESVITALIGAALGLPLGVGMAALVTALAVGVGRRADAAGRGPRRRSRSSRWRSASSPPSHRRAGPAGSTRSWRCSTSRTGPVRWGS